MKMEGKNSILVVLMLSIFAIAGVISFTGMRPLNMPILRSMQNDPGVYYRRAQQHMLTDPGYAITLYNRAIELDPEYEEAYYQRGLAERAVGNPQAALADVERALELHPNEPNYIFARGNLYKDLGDIEAALADFSRAIELRPEYPVPYYNRANTYYDLGELELALADYTTFVELYRPRDQFRLAALNRIEELSGITSWETEVLIGP